MQGGMLRDAHLQAWLSGRSPLHSDPEQPRGFLGREVRTNQDFQAGTVK